MCSDKDEQYGDERSEMTGGWVRTGSAVSDGGSQRTSEEVGTEYVPKERAR